ncbi:MAG: hypothetical protein R3346_03960 [Candidatus Spechtbacterales bacterium]|nr:hypothetical protein [Candidatus Spechtbacterales bacterium]
MNKKDVNQKFIISVSILFLIVLVLAGALWFGLFTRLEDERVKYQENRVMLIELEKKVDLKKQLEKDYQELEEDIIKIEASILDADQKLQFIEELESVATRTGNSYSIEGAREVYEPDSNQLTQINFNLKLNGGFVNAMSFLREVGSMPYLMDIKQLSVQGSGEEGAELETSLELHVFTR